MQQNPSSSKKNVNTDVKSETAKTDAKKVKKDIQRDLNEGEGVMTSREAGAMRD